MSMECRLVGGIGTELNPFAFCAIMAPLSIGEPLD